MSHNTIIKDVKFADIECLKSAVGELAKSGVNIALSQRGTFRTYQGQPNKCDYTVELKGQQYDVGLVKQPDGTYLPVFDSDLNYGETALSCKIEPGDPRDKMAIAKLAQMYAVHVAEKQLALAGHSAIREVDASGEIFVTAEYT